MAQAAAAAFVPKCAACGGPMASGRAIGSGIVRMVIGGVLLAVGLFMYSLLPSKGNVDMFEPRVLALTFLPAGAGAVLAIYGLMTLGKRVLKCGACGGTKPSRT